MQGYEGLELLGIEDVKRLFKVKESKMRRAVLKKEIPYIKLGGLIRFEKNELKKYIERQTVKSDEFIFNQESN